MKISSLLKIIGFVLAIPLFSLCAGEIAVGPDINYDLQAPSWLRVISGANYGGYCKNVGCKIKGKYVYIPVGKIEYLIRNSEYCYPSKCPGCKGNVEVQDWGFSNCCFQITGQKISGSKTKRPWCKAEGNFYKISMDDLGTTEYETVKILYRGIKDAIPAPERS